MDTRIISSMSKRFKRIQIIALVCFVSTLIVIAVTVEGKLSIGSLLARMGGGSVRSVVLLVLLFGIKSLTVVVPLASLYVAGGMLFPPVTAVAVSFLGLAVTLTIPYIFGRWAGTEEIEYIRNKYPKIERILEIQKKNEFLAAFLVRLIGWVPCDVLSFYFGACSAAYAGYLTASLLGSAISVITNTLLGDILMDPRSWQFAVLMLAKLLVSASVFLLARKKL